MMRMLNCQENILKDYSDKSTKNEQKIDDLTKQMNSTVN